jgi:hypothetical protein
MRASWRSERGPRRAGAGVLVGFALWVVAMSLVWGFVQSQAQSGAVGGVARVTASRLLEFAGQSALEEASYALRHPAPGADDAIAKVEHSGDRGTAYDPAYTRSTLYKDEIASGVLTIGAVDFEIASRPPTDPSTVPFLIDLVVPVTYQAGKVSLARQVRRRFAGRQIRVKGVLGPQKGKVVYTQLILRPDVLLEVSQ